MQIAVVLGMHKSGTSLVSEILHHSGIEMVEEQPARGYDEGFKCERAATQLINKDLLAAHDLYSLETIKRVGLNDADPAVVQAAAEMVSQMTRHGNDWGFKDPRTCLTYEVWRSVLPEHKLVCIFRDVVEVHHRYAKWRRHGGFHVLNAWYEYNQAMLEAYESAPEGSRVMLHYGNFMEGDGAFAALNGLFDRALVDRRRHDMRRSRRHRPLGFRLKMIAHRLLTSRDVKGLDSRLRKIAASHTSRSAPSRTLTTDAAASRINVSGEVGR